MLSEISTPAFLVDRAVLQRNCERMRDKAHASGVRFRPHVKTHKCVEIGRMQHGGATGPITVSTLAEAEVFARDGFRDITYAVPISAAKLDRAAALAQRIDRLSVLVDSEEAFRAVEEHPFVFDVFLKVDCGYHRAGVDPESPDSARLALRMAHSERVHFQGLLTHAGHSYDARDAGEIRRIAAEESASLTRFRALLGIDTLRSIGSTPTTAIVERFDDCDEVRPGNYVFFDAFQATIGSCRHEDVAVSVLTTVVGSYPERGALILDAGALALSKDLSPEHVQPGFGYGVVCDLDLRPLPMRIVALSQEHGKVESKVHVPVGTRLRVMPNHSCLTAAMYDRYHILDGARDKLENSEKQRMHYLYDGPENSSHLFLFAHGAGAPMTHPFMAAVAKGMGERGVRVVRFNFPYMEARKKAPDRQPILLDAWRQVIEEHGGGARVAIGGKSMGGRMASMVADETKVRALICFGYPFHPPGNPGKLRTAHLEELRTPALIVQGTRDPFGTREEVSKYPLAPSIEVDWIEGGDHSLKGGLDQGIEYAARFTIEH
ncbi:MAG TPA: alpha/beta family hydrolase [Thermoanaerobaculia bacterium]|nr:alpha/beta family hydrolase [Thermoanaerobaculia bacterium]